LRYPAYVDDEIAMIARFACARINAQHVMHVSCNAFRDLLEIHPGARQVARDMLEQAKRCSDFELRGNPLGIGCVASGRFATARGIMKLEAPLSLARLYSDPRATNGTTVVSPKPCPIDDQTSAIHATLMRDLMLHELVARAYLIGTSSR
jgi:hypothetical protein